jgi:hemolysin activation/secretion protein
LPDCCQFVSASQLLISTASLAYQKDAGVMRKYFQSAGGVTAVTGIWLLSAASGSHAQISSPSQVTPQSLRPAASPDQGITLLAPSSQAAPSGAEALDFLVGDVVVDGSFPECAASTEAVIAGLRGKRLTVAQVYAVARAIEQIHAQNGYVLARVVVPPQKLVNRGPLRLVVVDGFIEEIDVTGVPERARDVVAARIGFLTGLRHVRLSEIERGLLIAGDVPGLRLKSTLVRGEREGGTRLVLEGLHRLVTGSLGRDNRLSETLGTWQLRGAIAVNSALGIGEQVYGTVGAGADLNAAINGTSPLALYGGGVVIPLGPQGITLNPEYTHSTTRTAAAPGVPATLGTFERFALRVRDPVIWTRTASLNLNLSLEYVTQELGAPAFGLGLNSDRYAALRGGADYAASLPWGAGLQLGTGVSQGLGGRSEADAVSSGLPLSRTGAAPDFTKLTASVRVTQPLPWGARFDVIGFGQSSFGRPLFRSEQFALDGVDAVSAFAAGTLSADQGVTLRGELARPFSARFDAAGTIISPYLFGSAGRGWLMDATSVEQPVINAGALGFGTRGTIEIADGSSGLNLGLELARQFTNLAGARQGWRGNVNAMVTF